jgi:histidinol-phosphate phosphatase family protein
MIRAVLFDRDGTLIADAGTSGRVAPMPHAADSLKRLRARGMKIGVVTNQPAIARGSVHPRKMRVVHDRIAALIGAIDAWFVCPHAEDAGCGCRKPEPGLILAAQREFGVPAEACVVVGDIGSDIQAAQRAGARAILVPTAVTRAEEIASAPVVCKNLADAVERILAWDRATV